MVDVFSRIRYARVLREGPTKLFDGIADATLKGEAQAAEEKQPERDKNLRKLRKTNRSSASSRSGGQGGCAMQLVFRRLQVSGLATIRLHSKRSDWKLGHLVD
ncbi:hypothetical protein [uncultured Agrococcus sp.]|uniref:hypothetical protein n=1 Tax=uncultured Agrococcus sp. TaxID=382258 RepID=UPI0025DFD31D|nr:hypothetical protein [uncultured Agrococcus sp.]